MAKPTPGKLYRCLDSHIVRVGGLDLTITEDMTLLGEHPAVVAHPELFVPTGTDDLAIRQAKSDRLTATIAKAIGGAKK